MMTNEVLVVESDREYPPYPYEGRTSVARALTSLFTMWGKDPANPFSDWVRPGGRVVIKPNWVHHDNPLERNLDALVTHSSLVKHLIELAARALQGRGSIVIGDAPLQNCDFAQLVKKSRIGEVVDDCRKAYPHLNIGIEDWRLTLFDGGDAAQRRSAAADRISTDYRITDLGSASFLEDIADYADKFRVTCYAPQQMAAHHRKGKHEYLVTRRVFDADLMINLPKMKTHIKAGLTGALKNLVGINGHKEFLPHHMIGSSEGGGDCYYKGHRLRNWYDAAYDRLWNQYQQLSESRRRIGNLMLAGLWRASSTITGDTISTGSWHGNETIWRMTLDLNHLLYFGQGAPGQIISIVDGIVAGEGEGPLRPKAKHTGLLIAGPNPAYVDAVIGKLMGYNISRVPTTYHAIYHRKSKFGGEFLDNFHVNVWREGTARSVAFDELPNLQFDKPEHWKRAATPVVSQSLIAVEEA